MKVTMEREWCGKKITVETSEVEKGTDAIREISLFENLPNSCGLCQSGDLSLEYRNNKDYEFYEVLCNSCRAQAQIGTYKNNKGNFIKPFKKFQAQNYSKQTQSVPVQSAPSQSVPQPTAQPVSSGSEEDMPF